MSKKNRKTAGSLGRLLIKDRFGQAHHKKVDNNSMLHTTEVKDGYDWGRLNLDSVTEESSFHDFLRTAELAGTEFQAEKLNLAFVTPKPGGGILAKLDEEEDNKKAYENNREFIKIPRRPTWNSETTAEQLKQAENESFLDWRRSLARLQEDEKAILTPFEKNVEFWRQLWRVIERSDVVVQIVDARNPLLFRSTDLEKYVKEVDPNKMNMILLNKSDLLTENQRKAWASYFDTEGIRIAFYSALLAEEELKMELREKDNEETKTELSVEDKLNLKDLQNAAVEISESIGNLEQKLKFIEKKINPKISETVIRNDFKVLSRSELIALFKTIFSRPKTNNVTTIGLVGYPNVGKSSTINTLLTQKKVSVSATPGKTKHFQTLFLDNELVLCDCPGLVMPSFVSTKADMILNGILPIDQMRDYVSSVSLICNRIPRHILEDKYGIIIAKPLEGESIDRPPYAEELLLAFGYNRGFMTSNGQPDQARSARYICKDYVNGKLLYCIAPPTVPHEKFNEFPAKTRKEIDEQTLPLQQQRAMRINKTTSQSIDDQFLESNVGYAYVKGKCDFPHIRTSKEKVVATEKPWRVFKKEKREKLRKKYANLDEH